MRRKRPSKKSLMMASILSFLMAGLVLVVILASILSSNENNLQNSSPNLVNITLKTNSIFDKFYMFILVAIIIFLIYISFVFSSLVRNLNKMIICNHKNPDCEYYEKFFK